MEKKHKKWRSPSLGRDMEIMTYGDSGTPVLALPTRGEKCSQWEEYGMVDALSFQIENGFNKIFCIDSIDDESFFNKNVEPEKRILRHQQYETYVIEEVVPYIQSNSKIDFLIITGVDMGGYHAVNFSLKYPKQFGKSIGLSGIYDIRPYLDDFYNDTAYYNNPIDFLPNLNRPVMLNDIREIDFRLVSYSNDARKDQAERMSNIMQMKIIKSVLDIWDMETDDEWDLWQQMLKVHVV